MHHSSTTSAHHLPIIAVTPGEPAGVGPELICRYAASASTQSLPIVAVASKALLAQTAKRLNLDIALIDYCIGQDIQSMPPAQDHPKGNPYRVLYVLDVPLGTTVIPGQLDAANASYVLKTLEIATDLCLEGTFAGLVTGPIQKSIINDAGVAFSGHTEFLCERSGRENVVMMLATKGLRVALMTTHLPLKDVPSAITPVLISRVVRILNHDLITQWGIAHPQIYVCGLNPHAGEGGHMGREEIETIIPALDALRQEGITLTGPLPADTLFTPKHLANADAVLAMYHDQGLPVLKYKGFGQAVNVTLGLPFVRTSVDHGTALDLAGKGLADMGSLNTAMHYATEMIQNRRNAD
ncbi:4-hydroxythreonine-4-phosphate dehydrogenase PdxA [Marinagarivorans algicola]|uniref:4-hydroxythreonine-4-phosphate dehydrogenase PdxA n=1 Tax=Marinagarivorans algicola TaxID=1513270 RepID=UPI0006B4B441|nr:4-hydroxythreonine-4-phosphate dehydrogenase PdxA [Marinagarivorans algicola]